LILPLLGHIFSKTFIHELEIVNADEGDFDEVAIDSFGTEWEFLEATKEMVDKWDDHGDVGESPNCGIEVAQCHLLVVNHS
jgi:hypothetical protein